MADIPGIAVQNPAVETNIVYFDTDVAGGATEFVSRLKAAGIAMKAISTRTIRAVTHLDIQADHVSRTVQAVQTLVRESRRRSGQ